MQEVDGERVVDVDADTTKEALRVLVLRARAASAFVLLCQVKQVK